MKENRRSVRSEHDSVLEIYDVDGRLIGVAARLIDVSAVGASFAGVLTLTKGQKIRARLRLLSAGALDITGRVVRVREKTNFSIYGIEFESAARARRESA